MVPGTPRFLSTENSYSITSSSISKHRKSSDKTYLTGWIATFFVYISSNVSDGSTILNFDTNSPYAVTHH